MWLILAFMSAALLGCYDSFKKQALKGNAVIPVLFLNTLFSPSSLPPQASRSNPAGFSILFSCLFKQILVILWKNQLICNSEGLITLNHFSLTEFFYIFDQKSWGCKHYSSHFTIFLSFFIIFLYTFFLDYRLHTRGRELPNVKYVWVAVKSSI